LIEDAAITTAKIGDLQVNTAKIGDAQITEAKIANLSVGRAKIQDAAINAAKIENATITTAKIGDAQITNAKIANLAVDNAKIANLAVNEGKIANLSVSTLKIQDQAVTIPVSAYSGGTIALTTEGPIEVQSVTFVSTGAPVVINMSVSLTFIGDPNLASFGARAYRMSLVRIKNTASTILITEIGRLTKLNTFYDSSGMGASAISFRDTPGAGTVTYSLRIQQSTNPFPVNIASRSLTCLEVKK
jgi:hypothetical protein